MATLFRRKSRLFVGELDLSDLDMSFVVSRNLSSKPNTCEIEIYNLTQAHRGQIANSTNALIRLEAGYESGLTTLFVGNAREASSQRSIVDWVTHVSALDGGDKLRQSRVLKSFGPQTELKPVLEALAQALGLGLGNLSQVAQTATLGNVGALFPGGTVIAGSASRELDRLVASAGLEWSVQSGVLQLLARGKSLEATAVELTSDTGLLEITTESKGKQVKAKCLLIPDLTPGRRVVFRSDNVNGLYRISSVEYRGDTTGDDWNAELTCEVEKQ